MIEKKPEELITRSLTSFQRILIAAVIILLVGGGVARLFYSRMELTRVKAELKESRSPAAAIMADVKGAVANPGLISLGKGARVIDAVEAAGGFTEGAQKESLNLAAYVKDGEEIVVPGSGAVFATGTRSAGSVEKLSAGQTVNINTADVSELQKIPGIGPSYAERIFTLRKQRGPFANIEEIMLVQGIGAGRFERIKIFITIGAK
ncbi:MAG: helix-hairpin-helix domain-containing protein [bacterium]